MQKEVMINMTIMIISNRMMAILYIMKMLITAGGIKRLVKSDTPIRDFDISNF